MASGRQIKAGEAFLELFVKDGQFAPGLQRALQKMTSVGRSFTAIGASISAVGTAITAPFAASLHIFNTLGDELDKMSIRTGVSVEALSELGHAAEQSGTDLNAIEKVLAIMSRNLVAAKDGTGEAADALSGLGLRARDLISQAPEKVFELIATRIGKLPSPIQRSAAAMEVFGKSGRSILPLIGNFEALTAEARHFGLTISTAAASRAAKFNDALNLLSRVIRRVAFEVGDVLSTRLTKVLGAMSEVTAKAIEWVRANGGLIVSVAAIGGAITVLGGAVTGFGLTLILTSAALQAILGLVGALLSPFALITVGVAAAGVAFVKFTRVGQAVAQFLARQFAALAKVAREAFASIGDALLGGDIIAAANVLWAGLRLAWLQGTEGLRVAWNSFKNDSIGIFTDLVFEIEALWVRLVAKIKSLTTTLSVETANAFDFLKTLVTDAFETDVNKRLENTAASVARNEARRGVGRNQLENIEKEKQARLKAIRDSQKIADEDREREKKKDIDAAAEAAKEAQKKFDEAKKNAAAARANGFDGDNFLAQFLGDAGGIGDVGRTLSPRSTFNARLAPQIFGGQSPEAIPRATLIEAKKQTRLLEQIERKKAFAIRTGNG